MTTEGYKAGALAQIISQHSKGKQKSDNTQNKKLADLFASHSLQQTPSKKLDTEAKKSGIKRKNEEQKEKTSEKKKKEKVSSENESQNNQQLKKKDKPLQPVENNMTPKTPEPQKKKKAKKRKLGSSAEKKESTVEANASTTDGSPSKKQKKKKKAKLKTQQEDSKELTQGGDEEKEDEKEATLGRGKQRENRKKKGQKGRDKTKDNRTIFVGNLPITYDKKQLKKLFRKCGQIENVRFRCPPPADPRIPKKVIAIKRDFHEERPTGIGYVCFTEEDFAKKALKLNRLEVEGFHIRVDMSEKKIDQKRSVFVGSLPFAVKEEDVRNHFEDCGVIDNIRIIRDNATGLGKGFGYVTFQTVDAVSFALKLNDSSLSGRQIRVLRSENTTDNKDKSGKPKRKKKFKASNDTSKSFQGMKVRVNKKKMKKKSNKKFKFTDRRKNKKAKNMEKKDKPMQNKKQKVKGKQR